jgi:Cytochrome c peroxidase
MNSKHLRFSRLASFLCLTAALFVGGLTSHAGDPNVGLKLLMEKAYLRPDFDEELFSNLWKVWPEPLRSEAEKASPLERRRMAFYRYGLTTRPGVDIRTTDDEQFAPMQYVVDSQGRWTMNCLSCHGGMLLGEPVPGMPNTRYALETLSEDVRKMKLAMNPPQPLHRMDKVVGLVPLGSSRGTTNAVMFGVLLMFFRDPDLNLITPKGFPPVSHHDMDAPAWWNFPKKSYLYVDHYAPKSHRALMQFTLERSNGPEFFRQAEDDFKEIYAFLESQAPPKYPFRIDHVLAERGRQLFEKNCAECHGTYGENATFPGRVIAINEIGTDPVRFRSLSPEARRLYGDSWFTNYGEEKTLADSPGYVAPPLSGIWASAPYFHNGSVPTLWHVLNPDQRPVVWKRIDDPSDWGITPEQAGMEASENGSRKVPPPRYDEEHVGLVIETFETIPKSVTDPQARREYFDTRLHGKSAKGHDYPDALSQEEKRAVLEYLKTL